MAVIGSYFDELRPSVEAVVDDFIEHNPGKAWATGVAQQILQTRPDYDQNRNQLAGFLAQAAFYVPPSQPARLGETGSRLLLLESGQEQVDHSMAGQELSVSQIRQVKRFIKGIAQGNLFLEDFMEELRLLGLAATYLSKIKAEKEELLGKLNKGGKEAYTKYAGLYLEITNSIFILENYFRGFLLNSRQPAYARASAIFEKILKTNNIKGEYLLLVPKSLPHLGHYLTMASDRHLIISEDTIASLNDDELAWVIGHELAHATGKHARQHLKAMSIWGDFNKDNVNLWSNFIQSHERAADKKGFEYATKAGYQGKASIKALRVAEALDVDARVFVESLVGDQPFERPDNVVRPQTHPLVNDRVVALQEMIDAQAPGGIDLTRDKMGLQVQNGGQDVQFKFDPAMIQQLQNASGLTPVIIGIHPMTTSVPMFLSANAEQIATEKLSMQ